ncbi:hypothetical protein AC1031_007256 [Aphanomyces cochlioides]|nr:hypothetical protein AC1031_007256 [Aphanomyces cochlioides]
MSDVLHATRPELLPMEEVKHWHRVVVDLKALENKVEQVLASSIDDNWVALMNQLQENLHALRKIHNQAQWNAKYFKVLEKPFQDILSSDMKHITYMVPAMIKTLKMMWSSSKYYHDCFKMVHSAALYFSKSMSSRVLCSLELRMPCVLESVALCASMTCFWFVVHISP